MPLPLTRWLGTTPAELRNAVRTDRGRDMRLRRAVAGVPPLGIAATAATTLLPLGIVEPLPDPPFPGFDTKKVTLGLVLPEAAAALRTDAAAVA